MNTLKITQPIFLFTLMFAQTMAQPIPTTDPKEVVRNFLLEVRSGKYPGNAKIYMNDVVLAHQLTAEDEMIVKRSPQNYSEHIEEFLKTYGNYSFEIIHLVAEGNKVFALWKITGKHLAEIEGHRPTGLALTEIASATYLVQNGKIIEYWVQVDRLGTEKQLELNEKKSGYNDPFEYHHVDVFSDQPLSGNGLTVFPQSEGLSKQTMQTITQEMRQFESIFLQKKDSNIYKANIFTMEEELDFAGHPSLGAAAILHSLLKPTMSETSWVFEMNAKTVKLESKKTATGYMVSMSQGEPLFGKKLNKDESITFLKHLNLTEEDWDTNYPLQVVSTGLPYLLIPVKQNVLKSKIVITDLEEKLKPLGAKFVGVVETSTLKIRTWNNLGTSEDIATGSLAGPVGAFLVLHGSAEANKEITLYEGANLGRPSELKVFIAGSKQSIKEVYVRGAVVKIADGKFVDTLSHKLLLNKD